MTASKLWGIDPSGVSLVSVGASPGADGVVARETITPEDFIRRRADDLDAEAGHYRHRAVQEERALGPGYYVDLLRDLAADRAARAQRIRIRSGAAGDPASRRVPQSPSPVRSPRSTDPRPHRHVRHDRGR
jgi:hypothetical protein